MQCFDGEDGSCAESIPNGASVNTEIEAPVPQLEVPSQMGLSAEEFLEPIRALHRGEGAFVGFAAKEDGKLGSLFGLTIEQLEEQFATVQKFLVKDAYFTVNSMFGTAGRVNVKTGLPFPLRREKYLRYLNACYVDLDVGRDEGTPFQRQPTGQAFKHLQRLCEGGVVPEPSMFASSGRGLYVFWLLRADEQTEMPPRCRSDKCGELALYKAINKALVKRLHLLAADASAVDGARVLRIPGTTHSQSGAVARYITHSDDEHGLILYTLSDLAACCGIDADSFLKPQRDAPSEDEWWEEIDEAQRDFGFEKPSAGGPLPSGSTGCYAHLPKRVPARRNGFLALNQRRLADLLLLEQARGGWKKGHRRVHLTFYAQFLRGTDQGEGQVLQAVKKMALNCKPSYPSDPNDSDLAVVVRKVFADPPRKFKTDNLVKWLAITHEEARDLRLQTLLPSAVRAEDFAHKEQVGRAARKEARLVFIRDYVTRNGMASTRALQAALQEQGIAASKSTVESDLVALSLATSEDRSRAGRPRVPKNRAK